MRELREMRQDHNELLNQTLHKAFYRTKDENKDRTRYKCRSTRTIETYTPNYLLFVLEQLGEVVVEAECGVMLWIRVQQKELLTADDECAQTHRHTRNTHIKDT